MTIQITLVALFQIKFINIQVLLKMRSKSKNFLNYVETLTQIGRGLKAKILNDYLCLAWQTLFNPILWGVHIF